MFGCTKEEETRFILRKWEGSGGLTTAVALTRSGARMAPFENWLTFKVFPIFSLLVTRITFPADKPDNFRLRMMNAG